MRKYIDDLLAIIGASCISTGAFLIHISVGFIITGVLLIAAAYLYHIGRGDDI